jgi:hypothetical protein
VKTAVVVSLFLASLYLVPARAEPSVTSSNLAPVGISSARTAISKDTPGQVDFGEYARVGINTKMPAATLEVYQGEIKIGSSEVDPGNRTRC